jgi:AraC-like DNA-binding protein
VDWTPGYREWAPPGPLRAAVACLWVSVQPEPGAATLVLPDACTDLIWQRGKGAFVAGPDTGPAPVWIPPGTVLAGVRFRPGAGSSVLGVPLHRLLDQRVDAADVSAAMHRRLPGSLPPETAMARMTALVAETLAGSPPDQLVLHAARMLRRPRASAAGIAGEVGISERQLRRRFDAAVGYGPKWLSRVLRFQRFLSRLDCAVAAGGPADLAGIAADAGYADQPHLTRESVALAGLPPAALARARSGAGPAD